MKSHVKLLLSLVFFCFSFSLLAAETRTLEGWCHGLAHYDDIWFIKIAAFNGDFVGDFLLSSDYKVYEPDGKLSSNGGVAIKTKVFCLISHVAGEDDKIIEIYKQKDDYVPGTYNGRGIRFNPKSAPQIRKEEGFFILPGLSSTVRFKEYISNKEKEYEVYSQAKYINENDQNLSSIYYIKSGQKISVTINKVNGTELITAIKILPPQYEFGSAQVKAQNNSASANSGNSNTGSPAPSNSNASVPSKTSDAGFTSSWVGSDGSSSLVNEEPWDGWNGVEASGQSFRVDTYYGRISHVFAQDRIIQMTRADGKYKNFMAASDIWIFNSKGKRITLSGIVFSGSRYFRYIVRTNASGQEEIIDVRPALDPALADFEEFSDEFSNKVELPQDLKESNGVVRKINEKNHTMEVLIGDSTKSIVFNYDDNITVYDMYGRETSLSTLKFNIVKSYFEYAKTESGYKIYIIRMLGK